MGNRFPIERTHDDPRIAVAVRAQLRRAIAARQCTSNFMDFVMRGMWIA